MVEMNIEKWTKENPELEQVLKGEPVFWINGESKTVEEANAISEYSQKDVEDAEARYERFAPFIDQEFEDTRDNNGIIESFITEVPNFKSFLEDEYNTDIEGRVFLKRDDQLPIAGTIKARGAIYEVLHHAEEVAIEAGLLSGYDDDYKKFASDEFKEYFSNKKVVVGTTGNLGISVGVMAAKFGFEAIVHMSSEAKQWKKDYLRSHGVNVVEHQTNFTLAVEQGRQAAEADPDAYFVDDEHSKYLFLGYTAAGMRLKKQLEAEDIKISEENPLFMYLPCGVGGSPGGITFGLKQVFGDNVHCFFAEPTQVASMMVGLMSNEFSEVAVDDFDLDGKTNMDGLAVPRTSQFVAKLMQMYFDGGFTVGEEEANYNLAALDDIEDIAIEPAAVAGIPGIARIFTSEQGKGYIADKGLTDKMGNATHIAWLTGGSMVPYEDHKAFFQQGIDAGYEPKRKSY